MSIIEQQLFLFKRKLETAITSSGMKGKISLIRSSELIELIHDAVKQEFIDYGVNPLNICPRLGQTSPEIKLAGLLKQKDQDVCLLPSGISKEKTVISWGPMAFENREDEFGERFTENTLVVNIRSQMSSIAKNADTLFERTFAEAMNLHMKYPNIVLGEVYLIPVFEYDDNAIKTKRICFKKQPTNIERYISFFDSINNRKRNGEVYKYERCCLLLVDFSKNRPKLFTSSEELKSAGLLSKDFKIEYSTLNFAFFAQDLLNEYGVRFNLANLL